MLGCWKADFGTLLQGHAAVWTVRNRVETTFDEAEFLEGAKDAWVAGLYLCSNIMSNFS